MSKEYNNQIVLLGSHGLIGQSLLQELAFQGKPNIRCISWSEISGAEPGDLVQAWWPDHPPRGAIVVATGLTDPKLPEQEIYKSNFYFPQKLIEAFSNYPKLKIVTFGTILERFPKLCQENSYLRSKLDLGHFVEEKLKISEIKTHLVHLRLHTVYGKIPKRHSFLGQMLFAIQNETPFEMSSGEQLREYQHCDDLAKGLAQILFSNQSLPLKSIEINSGQAIRLRDLAEAVFAAFGLSQNLKIGTLERKNEENTEIRFLRSDPLFLPTSRDPIQGVILLFRSLLAGVKKSIIF